MPLRTVVFALLVCVACAGLTIAGYRYLSVRRRGLPVVVRSVPAEGPHGWRHASIVLGMDAGYIYQLASVWPRADFTVPRPAVRIASRREPTAEEAGIFAPGEYILRLHQGGPEAPGVTEKHFELAVTPQIHTALLAWMESAPSVRSQRPSIQRLRRTLGR